MKTSVELVYAMADGSGGVSISKIDPTNPPSNIRPDPADSELACTPVDLNTDGTIVSGAACPALLILIPDGFVEADRQWNVQELVQKIVNPTLTANWNLKAMSRFHAELGIALNALQTPTANQVARIQQQITNQTAEIARLQAAPATDSSLVP